MCLMIIHLGLNVPLGEVRSRPKYFVCLGTWTLTWTFMGTFIYVSTYNLLRGLRGLISTVILGVLSTLKFQVGQVCEVSV